MNLQAEWLEADGLGGFASGTVGGPRTRRYHALLLAATAPPAGRVALVNGFDAFVETQAGRFALSTQKYAPDVIAPDGRTRLVSFASEPWPTWTFRLEDGTEIVQELTALHGAPVIVLAWRRTKPPKAAGRAPGAARAARRARGAEAATAAPLARLVVRPFLSGRDYHALHQENPAFRFDADVRTPGPGGERDARAGRQRGAGDLRVSWRPYDSLPAVTCLANGAYRHDPHWYRSFVYDEEAARGFEAREDLGSPGELTFDLAKGEAVMVLGAELELPADARAEHGHFSLSRTGFGAAAFARKLRADEARRRAAFPSPLHRAADAYLVRRGGGKTIVAGYPWFTDWGRDTFIALRGLCLATGRLDDARSILIEWADSITEGMVPNRFPDRGETPEYNTVDGSLWFVVAVEELLAAARRARRRVVSAADERKLLAAARAILEAYVKGTRFGIGMDEDELLAAGVRGQQLTWMDARADGREVTPRIGKPVEIQALWYNAIAFAASAFKDGARWKSLAADVHDSFLERFWNEKDGCLFDVVDADHVKGANDSSFRPNQILAVGGLPRPLLSGPRARKVVDAVEAKLVTPLGLRTLAPDDPRYAPRYEGGPSQRDAAYHQGTAWPWLLGPFVDAWIRVRGDTASARREAHRRFLQPLLDVMAANGVAHLCEIADAEPPQAWKGCPFQAWSLAELLRVTGGARALARAAG
jgi:predicted glycogen debranching enzyme